MATPPVRVGDGKNREAALDTWRVYKRWAAMSRAQKARRDRQKRIAFWLVIVAIVVGPIAARPAGPVALPTMAREWLLLGASVVSGVAVALGAFFSERILGPKPDQEWVRAREGAEGLKSLVFEFAVRAPPFDGDRAVVALLESGEQVERRLADLVAPVIPGAEAEAEFPGYPVGAAAYVDHRLLHPKTGQLAYFENRVAEHLRRAERLEVAVKLLGGAAAALAVFGPLGVPYVGGWVPVISAVAAALTAQLSAGHHRFLCSSYQDAAARLRRSLTAWRSSPQQADDDARLVAECEATVREELARWVQEMLNAGGARATPAPPAAPRDER